MTKHHKLHIKIWLAIIDSLFYFSQCQQLCCDANAIIPEMMATSYQSSTQGTHQNWLSGYQVTASSLIWCQQLHHVMFWCQHHIAKHERDIMPMFTQVPVSKSGKWLFTDSLFCFSWYWQLYHDTNYSNNIIIPMPWCQKRHWHPVDDSHSSDIKIRKSAIHTPFWLSWHWQWCHHTDALVIIQWWCLIMVDFQFAVEFLDLFLK